MNGSLRPCYDIAPQHGDFMKIQIGEWLPGQARHRFASAGHPHTGRPASRDRAHGPRHHLRRPVFDRRRIRVLGGKSAAGCACRQRRVLVARDGDRIVGTVQIDLAMPPNQRHRAESSSCWFIRTRGGRIARQLMIALETVARSEGRTLLTLDTWTGGYAESLYRSLGYVIVGVIPATLADPRRLNGKRRHSCKELPLNRTPDDDQRRRQDLSRRSLILRYTFSPY